MKLIAQNKKARFEYFIEETFEVGISLKGTEVKSIRSGKASIKDSHAEIKNSEVFIVNMHISPYEMGNINNVDPIRERKILLHKKEIKKLIGYTAQKGYTLIPLKLYINDNGFVKLELAVAKGKKLYDKRESMAKKDALRNIEKAYRENQKH